jgi:predicted acylesterase/phospholipase RssA
MSYREQSVFEQVVFAGGGNRCWWQAGFWDVVADEINLKPRLIAGVSAGAATACMLYANTSQQVLSYYRTALKGNTRNAHFKNIFSRSERVFPHGRFYRQALKDVLGGDFFLRLKDDAPEIRVQFARLPKRLGPYASVGVGLVAYNLEKYWKKRLHPTFGRRIGFTPEVVRVADCKNDDELVSLLIASACTPPFTPIEYLGGRATLDGGMVDNVPVDAVEPHATTLVLVTRRYPKHATLFANAGRLYVQPSEKVPVSAWDYTSIERIEATYQQGRRDGGAFLKSFERDRKCLEDATRVRSLDDSAPNIDQ